MKEFTKADLKDGMVVEFDNGFRGLVLGFKLVGEKSFCLLDDLIEDMCLPGRLVVRVYKVNKNAIFYLNDIFDNALELIWERKPKHMTTEEMRQKLEELTGEKIEIEKSTEEKWGILVKECAKMDDCESCLFYTEGVCHLHETDGFDIGHIKKCYEKVMEDGNN